MNRNKIFIFVSSAVVILVVGIGSYLMHYRNEVLVENNGFSFRYPKALKAEEIPSTEGNYANYQISTDNLQTSKSSITISLPLKNTSSNFTLLDNIQPFGKPKDIQTTSLNGHQGQTITYRQDTNYPGDIPVHATITADQYSTKYETSPLMIRYFRDDVDTTLDLAWKAIRSSIKY